MNFLILAAALCGQADLSAEGYTLTEVREDGTRVWSRPVTAMRCQGGCGSCSMGGCSKTGQCGMRGCNTSQMGCSSGACGSRPMAGGGRVPRLVPIEKDEEEPAISIKPAKADPVDTDKIAAAIIEKLASDPRFKGPKGDRGEPGPAGPAGKDGKPGQVNIDELAAAVILRLPPVKLHIYDDVNGDGVMSEGETFRLSAPLGEPLKLEVTGGIKATPKAAQ